MAPFSGQNMESTLSSTKTSVEGHCTTYNGPQRLLKRLSTRHMSLQSRERFFLQEPGKAAISPCVYSQRAPYHSRSSPGLDEF